MAGSDLSSTKESFMTEKKGIVEQLALETLTELSPRQLPNSDSNFIYKQLLELYGKLALDYVLEKLPEREKGKILGELSTKDKQMSALLKLRGEVAKQEAKIRPYLETMKLEIIQKQQELLRTT